MSYWHEIIIPIYSFSQTIGNWLSMSIRVAVYLTQYIFIIIVSVTHDWFSVPGWCCQYDITSVNTGTGLIAVSVVPNQCTTKQTTKSLVNVWFGLLRMTWWQCILLPCYWTTVYSISIQKLEQQQKEHENTKPCIINSAQTHGTGLIPLDLQSSVVITHSSILWYSTHQCGDKGRR